MTLCLKIFPAYRDVNANDWAILCAGRSVFQELAWYQSIPTTYQPRLIVVFRDHHPVALLPFFILNGPDLYYHTPQYVLSGFRERELFASMGLPLTLFEETHAVPWYPAAVAMAPYGYRGGLVTNEQGEGFEEAADAIILALHEVCRKEGLRMLAHFYLNEHDDKAWMTALARHGTRITLVGADCNMEVTWASMNAYFRSLSPSRARTLRAERRKALADTGITWRVITNQTRSNPDVLETAAQLFAQTALKHLDPNPSLELYRHILSSWPGCWYLFSGETHHGTVRSAVLAFAKNATLYPKFVGWVQAQNDYFFLVYSLLLEEAIKQGMRRIEFGGGSHQAKLLRGASLRRLSMGIQVYDPLLETYLDNLVPAYEKAKAAYFAQLVLRYQADQSLVSQKPFIQ